MNPEISAALNEVLLQAALRAERENAARDADQRSTEMAQRLDRRLERA